MLAKLRNVLRLSFIARMETMNFATQTVVVQKKRKTEENEEELKNMTKEDLIARVQQLNSRVIQLKGLLANQAVVTPEDKGKKKRRRPFDFSKCRMRHVFLRFLYLGWDFHGFPVQEDIHRTIEAELFAALKRTCLIQSRETSNYNRCGRTDKGVSAFSQVISIDLRSRLESDEEDVSQEMEYCRLLNRILPPQIRTIAWCPVPEAKSARFDCIQRTYKYFLPRGDLDIEQMKTAAQYLIGEHDFRNLCKMDVGNGVLNYNRRILSVELRELCRDYYSEVCDSEMTKERSSSNDGYDMCELTITGQSFLYHQIRCIVAVLVLVGKGQEQPEIIKELLDIEKCPQKPQYPMASEIPLNLFGSEYEDVGWIVDQDVLSGVIKSLQAQWGLEVAKAAMLRQMLGELEMMSTKEETLRYQCESISPGVKCRVYKPLLQRPVCESLQNRIEHFVKKQRLMQVEVPDEESGDERKTSISEG